MLLFGGMAYAQVGVGISIGAPPPPRTEVIIASPGVDYNRVGGYWYPEGGRYLWHGGYWSRPPYGGARWFGPSHSGGYYHAGYWGGSQGKVYHDHAWDKQGGRDYNRGGGGGGKRR